MKTAIAGALGAALSIGACAPDPYAWLAVVSVDPDQVTLRYRRGDDPAVPAAVTELAQAQCAGFGRSARLEWDIELVAEDRGWPNQGGYERTAPPHRLRASGNHHARFACVAPRASHGAAIPGDRPDD